MTADAKPIWPRLVALVAGPLLGLAIGYALDTLSEARGSACVTAGVAIWMAVWWMTEAIPLAATALLPLVTFPVFAIYEGQFVTDMPVLVAAAGSADSTKPWFGTLREPVDGGWQVERRDTGETQTVELDRLQPLKPQLKSALTPYADKFVFLFLGGFLIAQTIQRWGLHRRMSLNILLRVGSSPPRLVAGFMIATASMSMWLSNTATTIVMLPVAGSLISQFRRQRGEDETAPASRDPFAICLMLAIAYAATIGGIATLIGTPPNALLATQMEKLGMPIPFATWLCAALPLAVIFLVITWWLLVRVLFPLRDTVVASSREYLKDQLRQLGPMSSAEYVTCCVFVGVAALWIFRTPLANWDGLVARLPVVSRLDDALIAIAGALLLFILPVQLKPLRFALNWEQARQIPWEILLLFGGGLSLSQAINSSGLGGWLGESVTGLHGGSQILLVLVVVVTVIFLTEFSSNLATAALFLPLLASIAPQLLLADGSSLNPAAVMVPTALAASCAFMLPVATPPNAIVFGSGQLQIRDMARAGLWLNLIGAVLITAWTMTYGRWMLGF